MTRSPTQTMTFAPIDGAVCIVQPGQRPVRLLPVSVQQLLDIFDFESVGPAYAALKAAWDELQRSKA